MALACKQKQNANHSSYTYVAWCFKAGGAPTASTPFMIDGTGYATASAAGMGDDGDLSLTKASVNTKLGFAIYQFNPNTQSETNSLTHGLEQTPELIITKSASHVYHWWVFENKIDGSWNHLKLNATDAKSDSHSFITGGKFADSTKMYFSNSFMGVSSDHMAYAFYSKRGVSKVGTYEGSTSSVEVNTGFEPAFVMIKNADVSGDHWVIFDNKRGDNREYDYLYPSSNSAEGAGDSTLNSGRTGITFDPFGFTLDDDDSHSVNENGKSFIYLAFANEKVTDIISTTPVFDLDLSTSTPSNVTVSNATYDEELGNFWDFTKSQNNNKLELTKNQALTNRTIEMWVKADTLTGNYLMGSLPDRGYGSDSYGSWDIYVTSTDIVFVSSKYNGSTYGGYYGAHGVSAGEWFHVAMICGGTTTRGFVNGIEIAETSNSSYSKSQSVVSTNVNNVTLGFVRSGGSNTSYGWDGQIGDVRIYNTMLTEAQILQNYRANKNNYPNGHHGTISNATWNSSGYFDFDGSGDSVNLGSDLKFDIDCSIALWINPDTKGGNRAVISKWQGSSPYGWILNQQASGNLEFFFYSGSTFKLVNVGVVSTGSWSHIVITYDGDNLKAYLNDTLANTTSSIGFLKPNDNSTNVLLCSAAISGITTQQFDGKISEVKMFSKALTAAEVTSEHSKGQFGDS